MNDVFSNDLKTSLAKLCTGTLAVQPCATLVYLLYTNPIAPSPTVLLTDLTPATFPGAADVTVSSWKAPYQNLAGQIVTSPSTPPSFSCNGPNTTPSAQGYAAFRPDTTMLQIMGQFDTAITPQNGQSFSVVTEIAPDGEVTSSTF